MIHNSILWNNVCAKYTSHDVFNRFEATMVTHSDIAGSWPGEGNIHVAPLFVNPSTGDYQIQSVSPCRGAGSSSNVPVNEADLNWDGKTTQPLPHDLNGMPRINQSAVDVGAYEWAPEQAWHRSNRVTREPAVSHRRAGFVAYFGLG